MHSLLARLIHCTLTHRAKPVWLPPTTSKLWLAVWKAAYWANPVQYCMSALAINEFTSVDWSQQLAPGTTLGQMALDLRRAAGCPFSISVCFWCRCLACWVAGTRPPPRPAASESTTSERAALLALATCLSPAQHGYRV